MSFRQWWKTALLEKELSVLFIYIDPVSKLYGIVRGAILFDAHTNDISCEQGPWLGDLFLWLFKKEF